MDRPDHTTRRPGEPPRFLPPGPPAPPPDAAPATSPKAARRPRRRRRWLRTQLPFALSLLVLLPLGMGLPWWLERRTLLEQGAMPPPPAVADGSSAGLAGSEWEFRGAVTGETGGEDLPEGAELVDAVFIVTPGDGQASRLLLNSCEIRAVDGRGRVWDQTSEYSMRQLPEEVGNTSFGCSDADGEAIGVDTAQGLVATFLVPEDAVEGLGFEIRVDTSESPEAPRPAAVLFTE
ncbi:hypothetical protein [Marinactinospora rubrisoli]|uniref:Uncharacterized protein n=1 Tax=Marinactinospora rubrisoli TaxID=2715399 RepID=A0ABW2KA51_9ACTN